MSPGIDDREGRGGGGGRGRNRGGNDGTGTEGTITDDSAFTTPVGTPTVTPSAYPAEVTLYSSSKVPLTATFTPPSSCISDQTLTWDVGRSSTPTILILDQFYRSLVEKDGTPVSTITAGYECFPPGYRLEPVDTMYFSPGVCPGGYYQASSTSSTSLVGATSTRTTFEAQCCPTSYTAYSETACFSNLQTHNAPIVGVTYATHTTMISNTMVSYIVANTSVPAFAVASLSAMFPNMGQQAQVIRPAVMIKYGDGSPEPVDPISEAERVRKIIMIAVPVGVVALILFLVGCICFQRRAQRKAVETSPPKPEATSLWVRVA